MEQRRRRHASAHRENRGALSIKRCIGLGVLAPFMIGVQASARPAEASQQSGTDRVLIEDLVENRNRIPLTGVLKVTPRSLQRTPINTTPSVWVPVQGGTLSVRLPPTGPEGAAYYTVLYIENDAVDRVEWWVVPRVNYTLRIRDVRIPIPVLTTRPLVGKDVRTVESSDLAPLNSSAQDALEPRLAPTSTSLDESEIEGLVQDLAIRPVSGPGFTPSRAVFANASGALEAVVGNLQDCVRVDGTAGPCSESFAEGDVVGPMSALTVTRIQNQPVASAEPAAGQALVYAGARVRWEPQTLTAGGDLVGPLASTTVTRIQRREVSSLPPASGDVLGFDGTRWTPVSPPSGVKVLPDSGVQVTEVVGTSTVRIGVDAHLVPLFWEVAAEAMFPSIPHASCAPDQLISFPGAKPGFAVMPAWLSPLAPGLFGSMFIDTAEVVKIRLCNLSGAAVATQTLRVNAVVIYRPGS